MQEKGSFPIFDAKVYIFKSNKADDELEGLNEAEEKKLSGSETLHLTCRAKSKKKGNAKQCKLERGLQEVRMKMVENKPMYAVCDL